MVWTAIKALGGRLVGSDNAAEKLIDNTARALDKLVYTKEEKADRITADITEGRKMVIEWLKTTSGQNLGRRLIAAVVTSIWAIEHMISMTLSTIAPWVNDTTAEKLVTSATIIGDYAITTNGAMMLVLGFYFAAPYMSSIVGTAMNKFGGGKNAHIKE